jgi:hypothetical protein
MNRLSRLVSASGEEFKMPEKKKTDKAAADKAKASTAKAKAAVAKWKADKAAATKAAAAKASADKAAAAKAAAVKAAAASRKARAQQALKTAAAPKKGVVQVRSLHVRKDHSATSESVGGLVNGAEVTILTTWSDGKNTWAKIGPDRWAAMIYNGETYIKLRIA